MANKLIDVFCIACILTVCIGLNKAETERTVYTTKIDTTYVTVVDTIRLVDTIVTTKKSIIDKKPTIEQKKTIITYNKQPKEWHLFDNTWKYDYTPIKYSEEELTLLTNILMKESTSADSINQKIDQYLVMICAIRRLHGKHALEEGIITVEDIILKCNSFLDGKDNARYKKFKRKDCHKYTKKDYIKHFNQCQEVVLNVLNCNIPNYVPYIPQGTFFYWNSRLDTNKKQKRMLMNKCKIVASTIKDHHFYAEIKYIDSIEWSHMVSKTKLPYFVLK